MKWLKSTSQKAWTVMGKVIPPCLTPDNRYLEVDNSTYTSISSVPVIKSLIKAGDILVLSEEPAELKNSLSSLQSNNAVLKTQVTQLQEELKEKEQYLEAARLDTEKIKEEAQAEIKAQAVAELKEKESRIKELEAELAKLKK